MSALILENGIVNQDLIRLARRNSITVGDTVDPETMNQLLQSTWMQRAKFRFQISGDSPDTEDLMLLHGLGCIDPIYPPLCYHNAALLLGGIHHRVVSRLEFLLDAYHRGAYFDELYLLGSRRVLDPQKEQAVARVCAIEIDMMKYVVEQARIPSEIHIIVIDTPDITNQIQETRPANTCETFREWRKQSGFGKGTCLVASNQPFVNYQVATGRGVVHSFTELRGIGPAADTNLPLATFLDNLAKQFYEEFRYWLRTKETRY